jgi:hypothetical protein
MSGTFISPANLTKEAAVLLNEMFQKQHLVHDQLNFKIRDQSQVDDHTWYTVSCTAAVAKWIRSQDREIWHETIHGKWDVIHNTFDIHEKLYTLLALKWQR